MLKYKKYIQMGLIITRIELVIAYNGKSVFDWYVKEVSKVVASSK